MKIFICPHHDRVPEVQVGSIKDLRFCKIPRRHCFCLEPCIVGCKHAGREVPKELVGSDGECLLSNKSPKPNLLIIETCNAQVKQTTKPSSG